MTNLKKPYSKISPIFEHDEVMKNFEPFIINKTIGLRQWPGTIKASIDNHKVMITYKCCKQTLNL
ncbi:hypothetical protein acsn021_11600 [Anaerocolumna cellulosilytica]|uniref:Uncharacterized protein n=1 Tax=Anaerocolumna cellulosilytica TaxID=433286 RepID=A0A6S6R369_9FIRM|nr:hypothetical protein [Anaerocolumna cellulosilytica]BCJ93591.1 hypothetical protein acsn021_11600 [Anaerocolumna cellulosilytica]